MKQMPIFVKIDAVKMCATTPPEEVDTRTPPKEVDVITTPSEVVTKTRTTIQNSRTTRSGMVKRMRTKISIRFKIKTRIHQIIFAIDVEKVGIGHVLVVHQNMWWINTRPLLILWTQTGWMGKSSM